MTPYDSYGYGHVFYFGNYRHKQVHGYKFDDYDQDGIHDPNEPGLAGVQIRAYHDSDHNGKLSQSEFDYGYAYQTTTDYDGSFWFDISPHSYYVIVEVLQEGWYQSHPSDHYILEQNLHTSYEKLGHYGHTVTPHDSYGYGHVFYFGNYRPKQVHGWKYKDVDADGQRDLNEPGMQGWEIRAYHDSDSDGKLDQSEYAFGPASTSITDTDGAYWLDLGSGDFIIVEVLASGWLQSFPHGSSVLDGGLVPFNEALGKFGHVINGHYGYEHEYLDFGNYEPGSIHGVKFKDVDADGIYDPGIDQRLLGVTFEITGVDGVGNLVSLPPQTTNAAGEFWFEGLRPGNYTVTEIVPTGYESSTHGLHPSVTFVVESGVEYVAIDGQAMFPQPLPHLSMKTEFQTDELLFGNFERGSIHGIKFKDVDANGIYDPAIDQRLLGVTFELSGVDGMGNTINVRQQTTGANGEFWFENLKPGMYTVSEIIPDGYEASTHGGNPTIILQVESGIEFVAMHGQAMFPDDLPPLSMKKERQADELFFGNFERGSIHGTKFKDVNANGIYEAGIDSRLLGVTLNLTGTDGMGNPVNRTQTTNANGEFWFENLKPGDYIVTEVIPTGYLASTHNGNPEVALVVTSGLEWVAMHGQAMFPEEWPPLSMKKERQTDELLFGNYEPGSIHGTKFKDVNADGVYDPAIDQRLAGVTFTLTGIDGMGNLVDLPPQITNDNGEFWFSDLKPGTYTVTEVLPVGYESSTHGVSPSVEIVVNSGIEWVAMDGQAMFPDEWPPLSMKKERQTDDLLFGNFERGSIHGMKFKDVNADGVYDPAVDERLLGVTFEITGVDGMGNVVTRQQQATNADGEFWFEGLQPGSYTVTEIVPTGYESSTHGLHPSVSLVVESGVEFVAMDGQAMFPDELPPLSMKKESQSDELLFGNFERGSIHGIKFKDVDADGIYDPLIDQRLLGVTFELTGIDGMGNTVEKREQTTARTASFGSRA